MKPLILALAFCASVNSYAQESSVSLGADDSAVNTSVTGISGDSRSVTKPVGVTLFLNAYPVPVLQGGGGVAVEYALIPAISLTAAYNHVDRLGNDKNNLFGTGQKIVNRSTSTGIKVFAEDYKYGRFFTSIGYQWGAAHTDYKPTVFAPDASQNDTYEGGTLGAGFRFQDKPRGRWMWIVDFSLQYVPGEVKGFKYTPEASNGPLYTSARIDTQMDYGFFPSVQFGGRF